MSQLRNLGVSVDRGLAWLKITLTPNRFLPYVDRFLTGTPFIMSGLGELTSYATATSHIASVSLPPSELSWAFAALLEAGGGTLLLLGYRTRLVAPLMALFIFANALFFHHNFVAQHQMINFLRNILVMGGLLKFAYFGAGRAIHNGTEAKQAPVLTARLRKAVSKKFRLAYARAATSNTNMDIKLVRIQRTFNSLSNQE